MGIEARGLHKSFGDRPVIRGVDLQIRSGEMVALLGPSGGGKSTILRMLAGLERVDTGEVWLDGRRVDQLDAADRGVGFVFQHYALFRHLSVADNVAFGLRVRGVPRRDAHDKAEALLARVGLGGQGDRWPDELSGGQRQRVALARALAPEPRVLLLDEPFGALDARVRADLRAWLRRLHDDVGATTILVTHDQEEALAVADQVLVVRDGVVEQAGPPADIVDHPRTEFVARFVGEVNVLDGQVVGGALIAALRIPVGPDVPDGQRVRTVIRSHELRLRLCAQGAGVVQRIVPVDDRARVELDVDGQTLIARVPRAALAAGGIEVGSRVAVDAERARTWTVVEGEA